jgi:hypothetical protein
MNLETRGDTQAGGEAQTVKHRQQDDLMNLETRGDTQAGGEAQTDTTRSHEPALVFFK